MKKAGLICLYIIGLAVSLVFRFIQVTQMTDSQTGFLFTQYENINYVIYAAIGVFVLLIIFLGVFGDGLPAARRRSPVLGASTVIMGLLAIYIVLTMAVDLSVEVGIILYMLAAFAFGVYMIYYGICLIIGKSIVSGFAVIPVIFAGVRLGVTFLQYYGLAKTVDIVLEILMMIVCLLFWHYFSKYSVNVKPKATNRWVVGYSLAASLMCFAATLPVYYAKLFTQMESVRSVGRNSYFDLATGIFIIIFLITSARGEKKSRKTVGVSDNGTEESVS